MMMDLCLEDENLIFALLDYCSEATTQFIRLMKEAGADMVSNGDSPAGTFYVIAQDVRKIRTTI
ncbi:hypothetical protein NXY31_11850 [Bacteroides salyersiae]|nr:hypothetical protein [Bacteroides salyersiae]